MHLELRKISQNDSIHYYKVISDDFDVHIGLNQRSQECYFVDATLTKILKTLDFKERDKKIGELPGIQSPLIGPFIILVNRVLREQKFPDRLTYCAG
jgi:hypothetical protein